MSRIVTTGTHPENGHKVHIAYGEDFHWVPSLAGWFAQVYYDKAVTEHNDEGLIVDIGLFKGVPKADVDEVLTKYKADLVNERKIQ